MGTLVERAEDLMPVSPPSQIQDAPLSMSNRPEIGGSFGGFIALVVSLAAVFVLSCIGTILLVRSHKPSPYERNMRGARSRVACDLPNDIPIDPPTFRERIARFFGRRSGWIRAAGEDGDEWDASEDPAPLVATEQRERERGHGEYPASIRATGRPREGPAPNASTDSVEVELQAPSISSSGPAANPLLLLSDTAREDADTRGVGLIISTTEHRVVTPMQLRESPTSMFPPSLGERGERYEPQDERMFSIQTASTDTGSISIRSMRKFDNGTKFKEGLSF